MQAEIAVGRVCNRQTSGMKERQTGKKADIHTAGRTATYKTGGRDCHREMGADDRPIDRLTG